MHVTYNNISEPIQMTNFNYTLKILECWSKGIKFQLGTINFNDVLHRTVTILNNVSFISKLLNNVLNVFTKKSTWRDAFVY